MKTRGARGDSAVMRVSRKFDWPWLNFVVVGLAVSLSVRGVIGQEDSSGGDEVRELHRISALVRDGKIEQAGTAISIALERTPTSLMLHALAIDVSERQGKDAAVLKACDDLVRVLPADTAARDDKARVESRLWRYHANRHKGEALYLQKKYVEAAESFAAAGQAASDYAPWRIRVVNRQADAAWEAGQKEEAIALREAILKRYGEDSLLCNNCVRVEAALARNLQAAGQSGRARKILDDAAADDRLDPVQKSWLMAAVKNEAWPRPSREERLQTRDGPRSLVIRCQGRWELRVDLSESHYGTIGQWYDLENDPLREQNLLGTNFFPLLRPHHIEVQELRGGEWTSVGYKRLIELTPTKSDWWEGQKKSENNFEVFERGPARVRFGYKHKTWPHESLVHTIYPDGRIYIATNMSLRHPDGKIKVIQAGYYMGVSGFADWRTTIGNLTTAFGEKSIKGQAPFTMMHANDLPNCLDQTKASAVLATRKLADMIGSYGDCSPTWWFRTPLQVRMDPEKNAQANIALFLHFWPNGRNSFDTEKPHVDDFQNPAAIHVSEGVSVKDDTGDFDGDGFNEGEGCYVVRAARNEVELTIDGTKTIRFNPVFKITGIKGTSVDVLLDGKQLSANSDVSAEILEGKGVAIVRLLSPIRTVAKLHIGVR